MLLYIQYFGFIYVLIFGHPQTLSHLIHQVLWLVL